MVTKCSGVSTEEIILGNCSIPRIPTSCYCVGSGTFLGVTQPPPEWGRRTGKQSKNGAPCWSLVGQEKILPLRWLPLLSSILKDCCSFPSLLPVCWGTGTKSLLLTLIKITLEINWKLHKRRRGLPQLQQNMIPDMAATGTNRQPEPCLMLQS